MDIQQNNKCVTENDIPYEINNVNSTHVQLVVSRETLHAFKIQKPIVTD